MTDPIGGIATPHEFPDGLRCIHCHDDLMGMPYVSLALGGEIDEIRCIVCAALVEACS